MIPARLLATMVQLRASDLHASQDRQLWLRIDGHLQRFEVDPVSWNELETWVQHRQAELPPPAPGQSHDHEGSLTIEGSGRFRTHLYQTLGQWAVVIRSIPLEPPTLATLRLPEILRRATRLSRGLVLVTGATGSGKSTTLAALLSEINHTLPRHIVTIEDPVEFVHSPRLSRVSQREVGRDTPGFASALRSALREDPDVILVGEMRDPETMDVALKAAETGHLVFSTVHTPDAIRTIARLVAMFPPDEQRLVRLRLAENLGALVSQRLVRRADGQGRVAALEIVLGSKSTSEAVADPARTDELLDLVERSGDGQSFEQHLVQLYLEQVITLDAAKEAATNAADLERALKFGALAQGRLAHESAGEDDAVKLAREDPPPSKEEESSERDRRLADFFKKKKTPSEPGSGPSR